MPNIERKIEAIKHESKQLRSKVSEQIIGYIGAGFGLIASLAWNEAIKALIEYIFPHTQDGILAKFLYAVGMTLLLVFVTLYLVKLLKLKSSENKDE